MKKYAMTFLAILVSGQALAALDLKAGDQFIGRGSDVGARCTLNIKSVSGNTIVASGSIRTREFKNAEFTLSTRHNVGGNNALSFTGPHQEYRSERGTHRIELNLVTYEDGTPMRLEDSLLIRHLHSGGTACTSWERK